MASPFAPFPLVLKLLGTPVSPQCQRQSGFGQDPAHAEQPELLLGHLPQQAASAVPRAPARSWVQQCLSKFPAWGFCRAPSCLHSVGSALLLPVGNKWKMGGTWTWQTLMGTWGCPLLNIHEELICAHVSRLCFSLGDFFVLFFCLGLLCSAANSEGFVGHPSAVQLYAD